MLESSSPMAINNNCVFRNDKEMQSLKMVSQIASQHVMCDDELLTTPASAKTNLLTLHIPANRSLTCQIESHNCTTYHVVTGVVLFAVVQWGNETITSSSSSAERPFYASIKSFTYVIRIWSIHSSNLSDRPHSTRDTLWATEYLVRQHI